VLLELAYSRLMANRYDESIRCYQEYLEIGSLTGKMTIYKEAKALNYIGITYREKGEFQIAL
jgi:tetratricopeptide (TPR) repeat protein